jgi:O-antigen/teichoic acid export membrane protein
MVAEPGGDRGAAGTLSQVRRASWYLVPSVVASVLPFLSLPVYTRVLSQDGYGAWVLASTYGVLLTSIVNLGLTLSYERNFFEYRDAPRAAALLYGTVAFVAMLLGLGLALTWVLRATLAQLITQSDANGALLFWTAAAAGVSSLKAYFVTYFRNTQNARAYAVATIGESVLGVACSVFLVAVWRVGPVGLAWGALAAALAVVLGLAVHFLLRLPLAFEVEPLGASLRMALPLTPRLLVSAVGSQFDKYIVGAVGSAGGAAVYAVGQKVAYLVFTLMTALDNVFRPRTYELMFARGEAGGRDVGVMLTPFAYLSALGALGVGLAAEEAVAIAAPRAFIGAVPVVGVLVVYYALMFFGKQPQLAFAKRTGLIALLSVASVAVSVPVTLVLARAAGAVGAALGTLLSGAASVAAFTVVGQRFYRIRFERQRLAVIFGVLALMVATALALRSLGVPYPVRLTAKVVMILMFLGIGARYGVVRGLALSAPAAAGQRSG